MNGRNKFLIIFFILLSALYFNFCEKVKNK
jgi:hypothetical protein